MDRFCWLCGLASLLEPEISMRKLRFTQRRQAAKLAKKSAGQPGIKLQ
jgi:hypothetical protein